MWNDLEGAINETAQNDDDFKEQLAKTLKTGRDALKRLRENEAAKADSTLYPYDSKDPALSSHDKTFSLPALVEQIQSTDPDKRLNALKKLVDGCKKSAFASAAIYGSDLLNKSMNLFQRSRRNTRFSKYEDEPMLMSIFQILSTHLKCAEQMAKNARFVIEMYRIVYNIQTEQQHLASKILSNITSHTESITKQFIKRIGAFNEIKKIFNRPTCTIYFPIHLWEHLAHLIEVAPDKAVQKGFFELFYHRIKHKMPQFYLENMKCFALLLRSRHARDIFDGKEDAIKIFYAMISTRSEITDYEYIMEALNNALESEIALVKASDYEDLAKHVVRITKKQYTSEVEVYCFSIIKKLHKLARLHDVIYRNCLPALKSMQCHDIDGKSDLIEWLQVNRRSNYN